MAQGLIVKIKNNSGSTIASGKTVYVNGFDSDDQIITVGLADYNDESTFPVIGITTEEIENGNTGTARTAGLLLGFDTSAVSINTEVFVGANGDVTFVDPRSDEDNNFITQRIGVVVTSEENGQIYLFPMEILERIRHPQLEEVLPDQHHNKLHAETHSPGGEDEFLHVSQHESGGADELSHDSLAGVSINDHHARDHAATHATGGLDSLSGQNVTVNRLTASGGSLYAGTSFPTAADGLKFYRTDLDWEFRYDSGRGKWLGELEWDGAGNGSVLAAGSATYLRRFNGVLMSSTVGIYIPYDITIVGVSMVWINPVDPPGSSSIGFMRNGVSQGTHSFSGGTNTSSMSLNINFAANAILGFEITVGGTGGTNDMDETQLRCWFRRRAT